MRRLVLLLVAVSAASVSACGETPRPATGPRVTLKLDAPNDPSTVRHATVAVTGTVTPADAAVQVGGQDAQVAGGQFSAEVPLSPGPNVIDVSATARGRRPAVDAVRVIRDTRVQIPQLLGLSRDHAVATLRARGLDPVLERGGTWLDRIIPGETMVCELRPVAGVLLQRGATVTLVVARSC